jgi:lysophospholipase L1-like esterase
MRSSRMPIVGILTGSTALAAALTVALAGSAMPANAATVNYVALGDSYSSGVGAGNYYSSSGSCDRSPNAYPALWAAANAVTSFTFAACSGATVNDVISSQLSALNSSTTLVSFTIGGNDAGFTSIMESCILSSTSTCENDVASAEANINATLPGKLATLLSDVHATAPAARVVVLGYPDFYDLNAFICIGLSSGDHKAIDAGINDLDGILATAAANNGAVFAHPPPTTTFPFSPDPRPKFSGHELCDGSGWLHSLTIPIGSSYHPTAAGQANGYLPAFSAAA